MEYKVQDVARYIINYSNNQNYGISNLKLQKLLYFVQAECLAFTKEKKPCFMEEIEAWGFGPVVPCVYQEYKQYGAVNIPSVNFYYVVSDEWELIKKKYNEDIIAPEDRAIINGVVDGFKDYSASQLVQITHNQLPWYSVYEQGQNNIITKSSIKEYFEKDGN